MRIGEVVAGRYELEELVGAGGMSSVFRAHDRMLERRVALKILHEQYSSDPGYVERFRREARAIARLSHPNIVTVIDRGEFEGRQFIVFQHVAGENLKELVDRRGPLPVEQALALAHQAARGLAYAHEHGVVHRDVKPHNVLVDENGVAKVTDFGIARSLAPGTDGLTEPGTLVGTSDYIAPEQAAGEPVDERTDQYSLGVLLFELLTGELPYPGENFVAVALRHMNADVPSVRALRPDVSPRVEAIVRRAMAKRPEERFPSTDALIGAVEAALTEERAARPASDGRTEILPPVPRPLPSGARAAEPPPPSRRGRRLVAALALLLALAALALVVALVVRGGDVRPGPGAPAGEEAAETGKAPAGVSLTALSDHDPEGGDGEHPEAVPRATDGDAATYWTTETYESFGKQGVGIVLDAGERVALTRLVVVSDTPGFTALVQAANSPTSGFKPVSRRQKAGETTAFAVDPGGEKYRYYLLWITEPNRRAHVNEVRAR